jgi:diguanylate cyclase
VTVIIVYFVVSCIVSVGIGFWFGRSSSRKQQTTEIVRTTSTSTSNSTESQPRVNVRYVESFIQALVELTSQVDSQVGEHSLRINEITTSLETPHESDSALVLVAGRMLIAANQSLQADLENAKSEIQRQREEMSSCIRESRTDALTDLLNRRAFDHEMNRLFAQRRRDGSSFSLILIDIDHFKRFNDSYGHMVGDQVLKYFARSLTESIRECDFVARFGGEEFAAILPNTSLHEAFCAAERVRKSIESTQYKVGKLDVQITASIGVKEVGDGDSDAKLIEGADAALYAATSRGRNRCCYYDGATWQFGLREFDVNCIDRQVNTPDAEPVSV